jgi:hypothetical protein
VLQGFFMSCSCPERAVLTAAAPSA